MLECGIAMRFRSEASQQRHVSKSMQSAWHGTSLFAIPGIARDGRMKAGPAEPNGIYCHKLGTKSKAQSYMLHTPIGGGIVVAPLVQLRVRDPKRVRVDQWLVQPENCSVEMIHFRVVSIGGLTPGREWLSTPWMEF